MATEKEPEVYLATDILDIYNNQCPYSFNGHEPVDCPETGETVCTACWQVLYSNYISEKEYDLKDKDKVEKSYYHGSNGTVLTTYFPTVFDQEVVETETKVEETEKKVEVTDKRLDGRYLQELRDLAAALQIPEAVDLDAQHILRDYYNALKGKSRKWTIAAAAALCISLRNHQSSVTCEQVAIACGQNKRAVWKEIDKIKFKTEVQVELASEAASIQALCSKMSLPFKIEQTASQIASNIDENGCGLPENYRDAIALYMATQLSDIKLLHDKQKIIKACGVKIATLDKYYKRLYVQKKTLFLGCPKSVINRVEELPKP